MTTNSSWPVPTTWPGFTAARDHDTVGRRGHRRPPRRPARRLSARRPAPAVSPSRSSRWRAASTSVAWPSWTAVDLLELLPARRARCDELLGALELLVVGLQHRAHREVLRLGVGQLGAEDDGERLAARRTGAPSSTSTWRTIPPTSGVDLHVAVGVRTSRCPGRVTAPTGASLRTTAVLMPARSTASGGQRHLDRPPSLRRPASTPARPRAYPACGRRGAALGRARLAPGAPAPLGMAARRSPHKTPPATPRRRAGRAAAPSPDERRRRRTPRRPRAPRSSCSIASPSAHRRVRPPARSRPPRRRPASAPPCSPSRSRCSAAARRSRRAA